MNLSRRDLSSHATLVFYEISLVPLSILATFFALSFVGGLLVVARSVAAWLGIGSVLANGLSALIVALTVLGMVLAGGTVVYGYQHFFDRSFGALRPLPVLAVPLLGLVGSAGYALVHLGTLSPPWWVSLLIVLCVHAVAFRTIAVYSMLAGTRRSGTNVGIVAAVPAILALITLVTRHILDAGWNEVGQRVADIVAMTGGSIGPAGLVVLPAVIAAAYGLSCTRDGWDTPRAPDLSRPSISPRDVLERLGSLRLADQFRATDRSDDGTTGRASGRARPSGAPPPSSPNIDGRNRPNTSGSATDDSGPARSVLRGGSGDATNESDEGSSTGSEADPDGSGASDTGDGEANDSSGSATDREPDQRRSNDEPDRSAPSDGAGPTSDDGSSGTGSDTRIFTDDFGQYDSAAAAVETCSECTAEIPSDGQYRYCPQCGAGL